MLFITSPYVPSSGTNATCENKYYNYGWTSLATTVWELDAL